MRRTSPRRFAPLATLCAATVASLVLAAVTKLGDTEQSFSEIVGSARFLNHLRKSVTETRHRTGPHVCSGDEGVAPALYCP